MNYTTLRLALLVCPLFLLHGHPAAGQEQQPQSNQQQPKFPPFPKFGEISKTPKIVEMLNKSIDLKGFDQPMKLSEALGLVQAKLAAEGMEISILVEEAAFKAELSESMEEPQFLDPQESPKLPPGILDTEVQLSPHLHKASAASALRHILSQVPQNNATFLIRRGNLVITTKSQASIKSLLKQKVAATFHLKMLVEVVYVLSDQTGASISLDPRMGEKVFTPIIATFANDTTLESALMIVTDIAQLRFVVLGDGIYITTPQNADKVRYLPRN